MKLVEGVLYVLMGAVPAGAVVASLAGTAMIPTAPVPVAVVDDGGARAGASTVRAEADCPEARDRLQRLQAQAHLLDEQLRGLRAEEVELVGAPVEWPDELEPGTGPEAAEAIASWLRQSGQPVHEVDCTEPPCLVTFLRSYDQDLDLDALSERAGAPAGVPHTIGFDGAVGGVAVIGYEAWQDVPEARRFWRRKLAAQSLENAVAAGEVALPDAAADGAPDLPEADDGSDEGLPDRVE